MELHGGTVEALSDGPGQGATFRVKLPVAVSTLSFSNNLPGSYSDESRKESTRVPTLAGFKILAVEDNQDWRELVIAFLESEGASARSAASVAEALAILERWIPDVLISDLGMPGEDGFDLISKLRARPPEQGGTIPALALSGYAGAAEGEAAVSAGYQMRLIKPIELKALERAVVKLVDSVVHSAD